MKSSSETRFSMTIKWKKNRIVIFALIAFTVYVIVSLFFVNRDIKTRKEETAELVNDIEEQTILNQEMQDIIDKGGADEDYIIKIAREKLNFVFPDETVYKDMIGN